MDDRLLQNLLHEADRATGGAPRPATGMATRVRTLQRRRRRQTLATGVGIAGLAVAAVVVLIARSPQPGGTAGLSSSERMTETETLGLRPSLRLQPGGTAGLPSSAEGALSDEEIRTLLAERSRFAAEAESQARVAGRMIELIKRDRRIEDRRHHRPALDALMLAREEVDKAAFRLIMRADDLRQRQGDENAAAAIYREVVQLFPKATSAAVAEQRLRGIQKHNGGML